MKKIDVMHLQCTIGAGGGPDKTILLTPKYVNKEEFNTVVVYIRKTVDRNFFIGERVKGLDINYHEVEDRIQIDLKSLMQIKKLLHLYNIEILHTHGFKADFYGLFLKRVHKMKLVTTTHGWNATTWREKLFMFLDKNVLKYFDRILVVNRRQREYLILKGVRDRKIVMIQNGIDTDQFKRDGGGETFQELPCLEKNGFRIGYVGRLSGEKGITTLLQAMKRLVSEYDGLRLALIGEGPLRQYLESYSRKLGLQKCVTFTGHIDDIKNVYRQLDLLVLPSETEGMPNVVLEALAMEVPVVATNVGGLPEIIETGSNGILVEPGDVEGLTRAIATLIMDGNLREKFALEGRRTVCERFSFERRIRKEEDVYRQLVS